MPTIQHYPFQHYCKQIIAVFKKAKESKTPALYLYKNNARTILFMMESILRVSNKLFEDKQIKAWHAIIKKLEDQLGAIDHYIVLLANFSKLKTVNIQQLEYISLKMDKSIDSLNKKLQKHDFYFEELTQMSIGFKIDFNDSKIVLKLHEEIKSELIEACDFFNQFPKGFTDIEEQVHELRRKLRWISIYAQSFQGLILLTPTNEKYSWEKEFITKTEINNPFNKLPVRKNLKQHISLNQKAFFALSFMISNIGTLKDKGLNLYFLEKSIRKTNIEKGVNSTILARKQLNVNYTQASLLKEAHRLFNSFFNTYKIQNILT